MKRFVLLLFFLIPILGFSQNRDLWFETTSVTYSNNGEPWHTPSPIKYKVHFDDSSHGQYLGVITVFTPNVDKFYLIKCVDVKDGNSTATVTWTFTNIDLGNGVCKLYLNYKGDSQIVFAFNAGMRLCYNLRDK